jgi:hypothetical protein
MRYVLALLCGKPIIFNSSFVFSRIKLKFARLHLA